MANRLFETIGIKRPKRSAFDLSFENRLSCEFGQLVPVMCKEVLPGDRFQINQTALVRLAPMISPAMSRIDVDIRTFFVPMRLVCSFWEDFITGGIDGNDTHVLPYVNFSKGTNKFLNSTYGISTLADYLGVNFPNSVQSEDIKVSVLPFKAYQKIWNDWYMDEILDSPIDLKITQQGQIGIDTNFALRYRRYRKDYFTSARPSAQLGESVSIGMGAATGNIEADGYFQFKDQTDGGIPDGEVYFNSAAGDDGASAMATGTSVNDSMAKYVSGLKFTGGSINSVDIAQLRRAFKLQEWQEKNSRGGNRYIENILVHFGVRSSDARLQRSQYIGGTSSPVIISEVQQMSASSASTTPIATLAGKGSSVSTPKMLKFTSEEHGYLISLMSILPKVGYMQGLSRMFLREDKLDFAWPEFANIGEQAIMNNEIYLGSGGNTFGYQSRYAEYKSSFDEVHGEFKSSLASWVQNRNFASAPSLNSSFVGTENSLSTLNSIFATQNVPGTHHFYCQIYNDIKAIRCLPKFGIPGLI